jgi:hypothetical protein
MTFLYLSIDYEINPSFKWSIYIGEKWSGSSAFTITSQPENYSQ